MNRPDSASRLRSALLAAGVRRSYVERAIAELTDHASDLRQHGLSDADLGKVKDLERQFLNCRPPMSFVGRHPGVALLALPPIAVATIVFGSTLALGQSWPPTWRGHATLELFDLALLPFVILGVTTVACRSARLQACPRIWPLLSCALMSCLGAFAYVSIAPASHASPHAFSVGIASRPSLALLLPWFALLLARRDHQLAARFVRIEPPSLR